VKTAQEQLARYKSVHLNAKNIKTHFIGVPLIIWSLFVLLHLIPFELFSFGSAESLIRFNVASCFAVVVLGYYSFLHLRLALGLALFIMPILYTSAIVALAPNALWVALLVFVIGWVIQLIGHHYEQAKPAFVDDVNQLLIGPFFLMAELYFMLGLEAELNKTITAIAITKRQQLEAKKQAHIQD